MRKDNWTLEQDSLLAETVLEFVKQGKTQLEAFGEVSDQLNRTKSAVAFRWNNKVRKEYVNDLKEAKKTKKKEEFVDVSPVVETDSSRKDVKLNQSDDVSEDNIENLDLDGVISYLLKLKKENNNNSLDLKDKIKELEKEHNLLLSRYQELEESYMILHNDYSSLMDVVDKLKGIERRELVDSL